MPEYFDISLIAKKTQTSKSEIDKCLKDLSLVEGKNKTQLFPGMEILVSYVDLEESGFEELSISFPEQHFEKEKFEVELQAFTDLVNSFFKTNCNFKYALCSYEINGYLLGRVKSIQEFTKDFLIQFPIVYERRNGVDKLPLVIINTAAQDLF